MDGATALQLSAGLGLAALERIGESLNPGDAYAGVVLNEFWATASVAYKVLVLGAMGLIAIGIALTVLGQVSGNEAVTFASLAVIGVGLVLHAGGVVIRGHQVQKRLRKHSTKG